MDFTISSSGLKISREGKRTLSCLGLCCGWRLVAASSLVFLALTRFSRLSFSREQEAREEGSIVLDDI
ncbi:hypothetical protein [Deinococcus ruber]|uniref:hypothetical protein n=1 Tax=Deinococcus ruber TaxID=1848197 RepID=UPI001668209B|nr:hypothetical protein [Deinococcus ruber]